MNADLVIPLEVLGPGDWADVAEICGEASWVCRMAEMGLSVGCRLQMLQAGCPCLLRVGSSRLSLRANGPECIFVRPVAHPDAYLD